ncbi:MAG: aminotransferase class I/II-fold pyridoxal phosphate-dependent enzyme [Myxococcales bacterium]|nr:aminotransferase class I/II-fold pyridoxal phosphate-dependent enzyme [Myxococcales bacterium]
MGDLWSDWIGTELRALDAGGLARRHLAAASPDGRTVRVAGRELLLAAGNGYLGLAHDPEVREAAREALAACGTSSLASRLVAGDHPLHHQLEQECADLVGMPCALVVGSGYLANLGLLDALARDAVVVSDRFNHASIADGCRLARPRAVRRYGHADARAAAAELASGPGAERTLLVTESLFSVDGDLAPLAELHRAASGAGALLVVDEAHALGVAGPTGRGGLEQAERLGAADVVVGTFGKALGSYGAFIAGSPELRALLVARLRTGIYSTALPPAVLAAALAAVRKLRRSPELVRRLHDRARQLRDALQAAGFRPLGEPWSPIVPLVVGDNNAALAAALRLREAGVLVGAMRPPTVPPGTARLRLSVSAVHSPDDVARIAEAVRRCVPEVRPT